MNQLLKKTISIFCGLALVFASLSLEVFAVEDPDNVQDNDVGEWVLKDVTFDENKEEFVLTRNLFDEKGAMWYSKLYYSDFEIELDYYTGTNKDSGADGITIAFYADQNYELLDGRDMAFYGSKGYGVELDTFRNEIYNDPDYNHIALVREKGDNHLVIEALPESEDGAWHHLKVTITSGECSVYVDGNLKFTYEVEPTGYGGIGITSATCAGKNEHRVKNIVINGNASANDSGNGEHNVNKDCSSAFIDNLPTLSPDQAKTFIKFICDSTGEVEGIEDSKLYKLITGDVSDYDENILKLKAELIMMTTFIRSNNASKIQQQREAAKDAANSTIALAETFLPGDRKISDADLGILSKYQKEVATYFQNGIMDLVNEKLFYGKYGNSINVAIDNISTAMSCFNSVKKGTEIANNVLNGTMTAVYGLKFACANKLYDSYVYFDAYTDWRPDYESKDDEEFRMLIETQLDLIKLKADVFDGLLELCGIPDIDQLAGYLENWGEYVCNVENYVATTDLSSDQYTHRWDIKISNEPVGSTTKVEYFCSICGATKVVEEKHEHVWSSEWSFSNVYHWHNCTAPSCDITADKEKNGYAAHDFDDMNKCSICGYIKPSSIGSTSSGNNSSNSTKSVQLDVSRDEGGTVSPAGNIQIKYGSSQTFTITPDDGYEVADVLVDGKSVGAVTSYTFEAVTENHTISATFKKKDAKEPSSSDIGQTSTEAKIKAAKSVRLKASSSQGVDKKGRRYIKVRWTKKGSAVTGYQVYRSEKKNSGYKKYFTTKKQCYYNTKSLKKGKRYYYKVRAYTVIEGKTYYSGWSNIAYRTVKKG